MNSLEKREGVRGRGENQKELINCWEFKKCGRQPDGEMVDTKGPCPAAIKTIHHRKNGGINAGRYCWKVAGTLCGGKAEGTFAAMIRDCSTCDFYLLVKRESGRDFYG